MNAACTSAAGTLRAPNVSARAAQASWITVHWKAEVHRVARGRVDAQVAHRAADHQLAHVGLPQLVEEHRVAETRWESA